MNRFYSAFLVIALLLISSEIIAQQAGYGLKTGLNLSYFGADATGTQTRIGLNVGGYYNRTLADNVALQPEFGLSLEGDDNVSFTNLNLGLLGKYYIETFNVEFGPQLGFILGDDNSNAQGANFSLGFGGNYAFSRKVTAGIRYNLGLSDVFGVQNFKISNNTISFNAFIAL